MADNELKGRSGLSGIVDSVRAGLEQKFPDTFAHGVEEPESPPGGEGEGFEPDPEPDVLPDPEGEGEEGGQSGNLNEALRQERARRQAAERKIQHLNQDLAHAKKRSTSRSETVDAILAEKRPDEFENWEVEKQHAWFSAEAAKAEMRANLGDSAFDDLRSVMLENKVLKAIPGLSGEQVEAVARMLDLSNGALSPQAAFGAAAAESPELFSRMSGGKGSPPGMPRVQEPGRSQRRRTPPDKKKAMREQAVNGDTRRDRHRAAASLIADAIKGR